MYKGKGDSTMRKWTALLCLILALCLLGGCTTQQEKAKVPISWYLRTDDVDLYNSLKGIQVIEDATGVDVTFQSPPNNSEDAYKMMVISGNLPDVIMWNHDVSMDRMYAEGLIIDLTDLIAQYAPNLTRIYTERPELRKQVETADGKMYYFPSINPMQTVEEICRAFEMVRQSGIPHVNADIIAGLPGEDYAMFLHTLKSVIALGPDNITVHTLAVKRASRLKEQNENYHYENAAGVGRMVTDARRILAENGYFPYYMYRQKHMTGNFENVSYARPGSESVYNIRIMDEHQTIAALGAGGISKAYYPEENRLERVPNVTNFEIYIERLDEMIQRKERALYKPFGG